MQWHSFESYFLANFDLDDDPTENKPNEKPRRERRLVFQKTCQQYVYLVWSACKLNIWYFNTFLQAEEPLIHILHHSTLRLSWSLLLGFIQPEVISESDDVLSIALEGPDVLKDFNNMFIGAMNVRDSDIIETPKCN